MKPNLKDFPSGQGMDCAEFSIKVHEWKEAFEKQLQEEIERLKVSSKNSFKATYVESACFSACAQKLKEILGEEK